MVLPVPHGRAALALLVALPALPGACRAPPPRPEGPTFRAVDIEARVAPWLGGRSTVVASDGSPLAELSVERCIPLGAGAVPAHVFDAFRVVEDPGPCPPGALAGTVGPLLRALDGDATADDDPDAEADRCTAVRNLLFGPEPDHSRPWTALGDGTWLPSEPSPALDAAYLDLVDLGGGDYGVEAASQRWFGRSAAALSPGQAALLAAVGVVPATRSDPKRLLRVRDEVLSRMEREGALSPMTASVARLEPVPPRPPWRDPPSGAPSFVAGVREELALRLGGTLALRQGVVARSTLDPKLQAVAAAAVEAGRGRWEGNRKQEAKKIKKVLDEFGQDPQKLAEAKIPDGAYAEVPDEKPSGAVLGLEPGSGRVRVLYDGRAEHEVREYGAMHLYRQAGSAFKTFIYAEAMAQGYGQSDVFIDRRYAFKTPDRAEEWTPKNHLDHFYGTVTLRMGLAESLNSVAIQLNVKIGPRSVIRLCRRLGMRAALRAVPALALGASPVSLAELVTAYGAFPSGGRRLFPHFVDRVETRDGARWELPPIVGEQVLDPRVAYVMVDMLRSVVTGGTGTLAKKLPYMVCGKTGTTNESKDTWFVGFSSRLVLGAWLGFDEGDPLGGDETGGTLALPVWRPVMEAAMEAIPPEDFPVPEGVVFDVRSPWNGQPWKEGRKMAFVGPLRDRRIEKHPKQARPLDPSEIPEKAGPTIRWTATEASAGGP